MRFPWRADHSVLRYPYRYILIQVPSFPPGDAKRRRGGASTRSPYPSGRLGFCRPSNGIVHSILLSSTQISMAAVPRGRVSVEKYSPTRQDSSSALIADAGNLCVDEEDAVRTALLMSGAWTATGPDPAGFATQPAVNMFARGVPFEGANPEAAEPATDRALDSRTKSQQDSVAATSVWRSVVTPVALGLSETPVRAESGDCVPIGYRSSSIGSAIVDTGLHLRSSFPRGGDLMNASHRGNQAASLPCQQPYVMTNIAPRDAPDTDDTDSVIGSSALMVAMIRDLLEPEDVGPMPVLPTQNSNGSNRPQKPEYGHRAPVGSNPRLRTLREEAQRPSQLVPAQESFVSQSNLQNRHRRRSFETSARFSNPGMSSARAGSQQTHSAGASRTAPSSSSFDLDPPAPHPRGPLNSVDATPASEANPSSDKLVAGLAKKKTRGLCRFWPNCYRGESRCRFFHPADENEAYTYLIWWLEVHPESRKDLELMNLPPKLRQRLDALLGLQSTSDCRTGSGNLSVLTDRDNDGPATPSAAWSLEHEQRHRGSTRLQSGSSTFSSTGTTQRLSSQASSSPVDGATKLEHSGSNAFVVPTTRRSTFSDVAPENQSSSSSYRFFAGLTVHDQDSNPLDLGSPLHWQEQSEVLRIPLERASWKPQHFDVDLEPLTTHAVDFGGVLVSSAATSIPRGSAKRLLSKTHICLSDDVLPSTQLFGPSTDAVQRACSAITPPSEEWIVTDPASSGKVSHGPPLPASTDDHTGAKSKDVCAASSADQLGLVGIEAPSRAEPQSVQGLLTACQPGPENAMGERHRIHPKPRQDPPVGQKTQNAYDNPFNEETDSAQCAVAPPSASASVGSREAASHAHREVWKASAQAPESLLRGNIATSLDEQSGESFDAAHRESSSESLTPAAELSEMLPSSPPRAPGADVAQGMAPIGTQGGSELPPKKAPMVHSTLEGSPPRGEQPAGPESTPTASAGLRPDPRLVQETRRTMQAPESVNAYRLEMSLVAPIRGYYRLSFGACHALVMTGWIRRFFLWISRLMLSLLHPSQPACLVQAPFAQRTLLDFRRVKSSLVSSMRRQLSGFASGVASLRSGQRLVSTGALRRLGSRRRIFHRLGQMCFSIDTGFLTLYAVLLPRLGRHMLNQRQRSAWPSSPSISPTPATAEETLSGAIPLGLWILHITWHFFVLSCLLGGNWPPEQLSWAAYGLVEWAAISSNLLVIGSTAYSFIRGWNATPYPRCLQWTETDAQASIITAYVLAAFQTRIPSHRPTSGRMRTHLSDGFGRVRRLRISPRLVIGEKGLLKRQPLPKPWPVWIDPLFWISFVTQFLVSGLPASIGSYRTALLLLIVLVTLSRLERGHG
jgi:hypothetical protein